MLLKLLGQRQAKAGLKKIRSYDVFDTSVTRVVGDPYTEYLLLGKYLYNQALIPCTPEAFARARTAAERQAAINQGEATLQQIYLELARTACINPALCNEIMQQEKILQSKLLRVIPPIAKEIEEYREQGYKIIFISDMHMPSKFIQAELAHRGIWREGDQCYVSCEFGTSKRQGDLFPTVLKYENIPPNHLIHCGNALWSDYRSAKRYRISARFFPKGNLNRYEKVLEASAFETEGLSSIMAGTSRLTRLSLSASNKREEALVEVASGVMAPVLTGYVLFVLQRARKLGLQRLYFLSTNGRILLRIAQGLIKKLNLDIELRYLYSSQIALSESSSEKLEENLLWKSLKDDCSIRKNLIRLGITPEAIGEFLVEAGLEPSVWDKKHRTQNIRILKHLLQKEKVQSIIFSSIQDHNRNLTCYLNQEGLFDAVKKGVVDIDWSGSSYYSLVSIYKEFNMAPPVGFVYGLVRSPVTDLGHVETYNYDLRYPLGNCDIYFNNLIEIFCSTEHGKVIGWQKLEDDKIVPKFEEEKNQKLMDWGLSLVWQVIDCFTEYLWLDRNFLNLEADLRSANREVMHLFKCNPSRSEAEAWGSFPWKDHHTSMQYSWAQPLTLTQLLRALSKGKLPSHFEHEWLEGAVRLSSPWVASAIRYYLVVGSMLNKIKAKIRRELSIRIEFGLGILHVK